MNLNIWKEQSDEARLDQDSFVWRVWVAVAITLAFLILLMLVWRVIDVLMVVFGGILLGIFLRSLSHWLSQRTPLPEGWSLFGVVVVIVLVVAASVWFLAPELAHQFDQLVESLPRSLERLREYVSLPDWSQGVTSQLPDADQIVPDNSDLFSRITTIFSTTLGMLANIVIILVVGIYTAADPYTYINGFLQLIPVHKRLRIRDVLDEVHHTLQRWLVGTAISMGAIALLTTLGLWLLDVPLALLLGLLAGLFEFIPYIGPILSVVPAALLGLLEGPSTALYVILLYLAIQQFEGYILTPLVQQRAISIPPALIITAQLVIGVLVGGIGLLFATPLTAVVVVLIKNLYVEDTLEQQQVSK